MKHCATALPYRDGRMKLKFFYWCIKTAGFTMLGQKRQKGIVLPLALILLAIVSTVATFAIRSTISGEQVAKAMRG